jgi:hypothetical protein
VFADTDSDGMPDYWENTHGTNPAIQDHNGTGLSQGITGVSGYTNIECYLNCLSDALVSGQTTPACGIQAFTTGSEEPRADISVHVQPNPVSEKILISYQAAETDGWASLFDMQGQLRREIPLPRAGGTATMPVADLEAGVYVIKWEISGKIDNSRILIQKAE